MPKRKRRRNLWPFDAFKKTTVYHLRGKRAGVKESSTSRYKGYAIYKRTEGFTVPALDRESVFDDKREAKRFIDAMKNPRRRKRNLTLSIPRNKWINAKVQITKDGRVQALVSQDVLGHAQLGGGARLNPRRRNSKRKTARRRKR